MPEKPWKEGISWSGDLERFDRTAVDGTKHLNFYTKVWRDKRPFVISISTDVPKLRGKKISKYDRLHKTLNLVFDPDSYVKWSQKFKTNFPWIQIRLHTYDALESGSGNE